MNWFHTSGVVAAYSAWIFLAALTDSFPLGSEWRARALGVWLAGAFLLQTVPWGRFARRVATERPLGITFLSALAAHCLIGAVAVIIAPDGRGILPLDPPPPLPGGSGIHFSIGGDDLPVETSAVIAGVLFYGAISAVWASIVGAMALEYRGALRVEVRDLLRLVPAGARPSPRRE